MRETLIWHAVADGDCWTVSPDPQRPGWETDCGCPGYGISRQAAEYLAKSTRLMARVSEIVEVERMTRLHQRWRPAYAPYQNLIMDLEGLISQ